jgi:hypothetical protein
LQRGLQRLLRLHSVASQHSQQTTRISAATTPANDARSTHIAMPLLHRYHRIDSSPHKPSHSIHAVRRARRHHRPPSALHTYGTSAATTVNGSTRTATLTTLRSTRPSVMSHRATSKCPLRHATSKGQ